MSVFEFVFEGGWRERVAASGDDETPDERGEVSSRVTPSPDVFRAATGLCAMLARLAGLTHNRGGPPSSPATRAREPPSNTNSNTLTNSRAEYVRDVMNRARA